MDAVADLGIGNVLQTPLLEIWQGDKLRRIREQFENQNLNPTCAACDMYRNLELYRTREGRLRADLNRQRASGHVVARGDRAALPFSGG
jgi:Iron-sulfur cluster-binding domain